MPEIQLKYIKNKKLNFKNLLNKTDTIIWKKSENLEICVDSKINKFHFDNCNSIKLYLYGTISGLEINNCNDFTIIIPKNHSITCIDLYKSYVTVNDICENFHKIPLINENSKIIFI